MGNVVCINFAIKYEITDLTHFFVRDSCIVLLHYIHDINVVNIKFAADYKKVT